MVERVKRLGAELQIHAFTAQFCVLEQGHIPALEAGTGDHAAPCVAWAISAGWSWDERGGIEELRDRMWSVLIRVADHIRPGAEEFSRVIQQGESLLAGARTLSGSTLSSLHFMVGDAYATVVWLSQTTDSEYHDPKKYQQMAESARAKALEHYRAALNLEHGTARSQKAWKEAWRLAAGLPPAHGRSFCVYD